MKEIKKLPVIEIGYNGIPMDAEYRFWKAEERTWDYDGTGAIVELHSVKVGGVDITDLLNIIMIVDIEKILLEKLT
jgi:hypothetical protein